MDRRWQKTRKAIFKSFRALLEKKRYDHITVQEIIDGADVGRSTFYAHFETKDLLLEGLCAEMFHHVFENDPCPFQGQDYTLQAKLSHILWHVLESRSDLSSLFLSDSSTLFMSYFKKHLRLIFQEHIDEFSPSVPKEFLLHHVTCSFAEGVKWWAQEDFSTPLNDVCDYILQTLPLHR